MNLNRICSVLLPSIFYRMIDTFFELVAATGFICSTALFTVLESFILNMILTVGALAIVALHSDSMRGILIYYLVSTLVFNLYDIKQHSKREVYNYEKIIRIDEHCTRVRDFVDRLLPRHVCILKPDPREPHARGEPHRHLRRRHLVVR